ncbi:hypothetical protein BCR33DRAFT_852199 [Rhizoclosmatium globosum]|uniref:Uncharacterized protein n=1 Tax=Rhizoclosmatium globosum TaxID=329046 RepID=A0A1Y2C3Y0_9FUNG|nr:hypothetical protein BCR33DRAFT_852199 [Rhizoclosmatium globosum]|eukprot:ORY41711.1 hypothetical protein BCR33DRAFT_852199 [Rhizoclosmatium globosum]
MSVQVVPSSAFITMPWANGQGQTCQLFKLVHPLKPDQFALRLSVATVSQGSPFSSFVGIDRQLSLLEGDGMVLTMEDGSKHILDVPGKVVEFGGEVKVDCELIGGVLRDFNVMVARDWGTAIGPFEYRIVKEEWVWRAVLKTGASFIFTLELGN